ncbi:thiamine pyrophosphate-dependent enzyme [Desulforamulus ruminis]|uniref:Thiamine pyrophosphate TPP-binding domain-containing protein n=1 Tax=Desulforamulus ruminis (strain ATCC 23193 / DSM 2154 / NCIMB 8452 / DL) TaxID=696281 RepID=F6DLV8_DESRL|nr:thiamine pyrophosphate-dependent enzyme [Desulforamulus ruminis]AEG58401.1 thiamine pyrophosphate TPP-binding domain-containing protein [Desulforamulus ruminis DSM 2154]
MSVNPQPAMPKSWRVESKPHKFCPGCGHGQVLKCLGEAIDELGIQDRVVFGCDIGCSLLSWDFFNCDSVQTHHGRTTPVMTGIKRANPDLICIAYMGDGGGYAIGVGGIVNAAARNEKVTVLLANNTVYAMTGGQMSPCTMPGQKVETAPYGRDAQATGMPTQGPEMISAITGDGAYVARGSVANLRQLKSYIKKALENQMQGNGFSFVEALASCPTNWRTNAQKTWAFVEKEMTQYFKVGEKKNPFEAKKEAQQNG